MPSSYSWPAEFPRTPAEERCAYPHGFQVDMQRAFRNIVTQLERMDVDDYRVESGTDHRSDKAHLPYASAPNRPEDPGVVARWSTDGEQYAAACDAWNNIRDNAQALAKYLDAKRALERYGVATAASEFAAQRLPPAEEAPIEGASSEDADGAADPRPDPEGQPHEVLGVRPDAPAAVVKGAARSLAKDHHPDRGGDEEQFKRIQTAKDALLDDTEDR